MKHRHTGHSISGHFVPIEALEDALQYVEDVAARPLDEGWKDRFYRIHGLKVVLDERKEGESE